jgi:[ribosomal protein S5]-alanine N-acetyltransferase
MPGTASSSLQAKSGVPNKNSFLSSRLQSRPDPAMHTLRTERLVLEPLLESHAAEMFRVLIDPLIYTFLHERPPFTEDELRARYRFLEKRRSPDGTNELLTWVVRDTEGELYGLVSAEVFAKGTADLSVVLTPRVWRRGYAYEAMGAVMKELERNRRVSVFFGTVAPRNDAAIKLLQRLGFRMESVRPEEVRLNNGNLIFVTGRGS